ncbi:hypothetical protein MAPG_08465 [Magnaporthiopsis poae ATCC 64411]|uniref:VWFA domain-containing protein n=1 Tax=Magnaporthiopsis poae (strain ATCC 64411 / 73-15) TaxID=644358 RepID=A0A0C4E7F2_MAGP6|nr:hypothetical protein MAPG_08465 [Magnaporthiopsis poae ATCC 64411]
MTTLATRTSFCHNKKMSEKRSFLKSISSRLSMRKSSNPFTGGRGVQAGGGEAPPDAPPPAYSAEPPAQPPASASGADPFLTPYRQRSGSGFELSSEDVSSSSDPYAFLSKFDTIFLIDDSSSMSSGTRWEEVKTVLYQIVPVCAAHDVDGIDILFLNNRAQFKGVKNASAVSQVFETVYPAGLTPTGVRINEILGPYVDEYAQKAARKGPKKTGMKPLNLIVITDGAPTDRSDQAVQTVLHRIASQLDRAGAPLYQVGVQFFQVGDDAVASRALQELDDNLGGLVAGGQLRDIVDTCTFDVSDGGVSALTSEAVLKTVLGAVVKRFDNQMLYDSRR